MEKSVILSAYGNGAPMYDDVMGVEWEPTTDRSEIMEWLELKPGDNLLDVCVGTGLSFPHYPAGVNVIGIDFTQEMLRVGREKIARNGWNIELSLMDASRMSFEDQVFDAVVETYALCVVPNPQRVMEEMARVCKRGGSIVIFDCVLSEIPSVAKNQRLVQPLTSKIGIPENVIVWDPTRDYVEIAQQIPELQFVKMKRFDQDDLFKSRCMIQFKRA